MQYMIRQSCDDTDATVGAADIVRRRIADNVRSPVDVTLIRVDTVPNYPNQFEVWVETSRELTTQERTDIAVAIQ